MLRILFINALMFALPFAMYGVYIHLARKNATKEDVWSNAPILWLLGASTLLVFGAMITLVSFSGSKPGGTYHPPRYDNGAIKPGHVR